MAGIHSLSLIPRRQGQEPQDPIPRKVQRDDPPTNNSTIESSTNDYEIPLKLITNRILYDIHRK